MSFYSSYVLESCEYFSESWREHAYEYAAEWGWSVNGGASENITNHVTGSVGGMSGSSWYYESGSSSSGCVSSNSHSCECDHGNATYDETISRTGWYDNDQVSPPFSAGAAGSGGGNGGDPFDEIAALNTHRLQGFSALGAKMKNAANTASGLTSVGSAYEALAGRNASGDKLSAGQRALAAVGTAPGGKIVGVAVDLSGVVKGVAKSKPTYVVNVEHVKLRYFDKTLLPKDAEAVYNGALLAHGKHLYGKGEEGVYRFTIDKNNQAHFTGIVDLVRDTYIPGDIRRAFQ